MDLFIRSVEKKNNVLNSIQHSTPCFCHFDCFEKEENSI